MLKITITCPCQETFSVSSEYVKNQNGLCCPNCGKFLPDKVSVAIRNCLDEYAQVIEILNEDTGYSVSAITVG